MPSSGGFGEITRRDLGGDVVDPHDFAVGSHRITGTRVRSRSRVRTASCFPASTRARSSACRMEHQNAGSSMNRSCGIAQQRFHLRADGLDAQPIVIQHIHVHDGGYRSLERRYPSSASAPRSSASCRWIAAPRTVADARRAASSSPLQSRRMTQSSKPIAPHHTSPTNTGNFTRDTTPCVSRGIRSLSGNAATVPCTTSPLSRMSSPSAEPRLLPRRRAEVGVVHDPQDTRLRPLGSQLDVSRPWPSWVFVAI